jgi:acetoin utilization deacetylase AcuC-like enzyme
MNYSPNILTFYRTEQSIDIPVGYSKSPNKPKLLLDWLKKNRIKRFPTKKNWQPFDREDFYLAHTKKYVDSFFSGGTYATSNGLDWNPKFAESVRFTNSSLFHAIHSAIKHPETITFSPTSGFHHATPERGGGYCTFSGQVIASLKLYYQYKLSGAYIDLDQHFGNSIEDSRSFCPDLDFAIPSYANVNPSGEGEAYIRSLKKHLLLLEEKILAGEIHYLVLCSGADSLEDDDLGHALRLEDWLHCKKLVYEWIGDLYEKRQSRIPVTITLFGGYREDHFDSVLDAHTQDLLLCLEVLCGGGEPYQSVYKKRGR